MKLHTPILLLLAALTKGDAAFCGCDSCTDAHNFNYFDLHHKPSFKSIHYQNCLPIVHTGTDINQSFRMHRVNIKRVFKLSSSEISINMLQLAMLITICGLVRIVPIANWLAHGILSRFPSEQMLDHEPMSLVNVVVHSSALAYNTGIIQNLLGKQIGVSRPNNHKRISYAIISAGLGQLFGMGYVISHSLIGTGSVAQQGFHNVSNFFMKVSAMSLGCVLMLPLTYSYAMTALIAVLIMQGYLSFTSIPGIALLIFGLVGVLTSSKEDFPMMFKVGYMMLSMLPLVSNILDKTLGSGTDLAHTLGAAWLAMITILQRWSIADSETAVHRNE